MGWQHPVWICGASSSAYGVLGAMAAQLADAFGRLGVEVRPATTDLGPRGLCLFFNHFASIEGLPEAVVGGSGGVATIQLMVDHPLTMHAPPIDAWSRRSDLARFYSAFTSVDDAHLLRMRWPALRHGYLLHGVDPGALAREEDLTPEAWAARPYDVIAAGSIETEEAVRQRMDTLPPRLRVAAERIAAMMTMRPTLGFLRAADLELSTLSAMVHTDPWDTLAALFGPVMAAVNRARRLAWIGALSGLRVGLIGDRAGWAAAGPVPGVELLGRCGYAEIPGLMRRGRVGLAWGPTQFVESVSERILLTMAAGCATVADDRTLARPIADGGRCAQLFDGSDPRSLRAAVDRLLARPDRSRAMAAEGAREIARAHLWDHRAARLLEIAADRLEGTGTRPAVRVTESARVISKRVGYSTAS